MKKTIALLKCAIVCFQALIVLPTASAQPYSVTVTTSATAPVDPLFNQALFRAGKGIRVVLMRVFIDSSLYADPLRYKLSGRLERLPPSPFSIELKPELIPASPNLLPITNSFPYPITLKDFSAAFGDFNPSNLNFSGTSPADIVQPGNNFVLPDGVYRICFTVLAELRAAVGGPSGNYKTVSAPGSGCAVFTLCTKAGSAPQFTQPVNNLNINSSVPVIRPSSPVVFTWTPPQSVCGLPPGGYKYDFEIHEIFNNQSVTDAINNPFVFQKTGLPAPTFLLDTLLYRNVLQAGKRYAIRVRAANASLRDTISITNNGYSRVEAFQYGTGPDVVATPFPVQKPEFYYIPFGERKTSHWDDVYTAYQNRRRRDTLVPIREYIALHLIQNGIAYNPDAIELFMTLNPELAGLKEVQLGNRPRLPDFPVLPEADLRKFETQHTANLLPEAREAARFKNLLDSLKASGYKQSLPDTAARPIAALDAELTAYNRKALSVNHISMNLLNELLAELVYNLRTKQKDEAHLRSVVANIRELMETSLSTTSFLLPEHDFKRWPLPLSPPALHLSLAGYTLLKEGDGKSDFLPVEAPLLPLSVIVWRKSTEPPPRAVYNSPDLTAAFRVFYTTPPLYNHKNPEINAHSLPGLASTAQVSLPKLAHFKFWTLNMVTHKWTNAEDIETNDVFLLNNKKKWPNSKKLYVVLKVD